MPRFEFNEDLPECLGDESSADSARQADALGSHASGLHRPLTSAVADFTDEYATGMPGWRTTATLGLVYEDETGQLGWSPTSPIAHALAGMIAKPEALSHGWSAASSVADVLSGPVASVLAGPVAKPETGMLGWGAANSVFSALTGLAGGLKTDASAWPLRDSVTFLTDLVSEPDFLHEIFPAEFDIAEHSEDAQPTVAGSSPSLSDSLRRISASKSKQIAFAAYIISALALHLSNVLSTRNRVFDPHQLITDEVVAVCLALAIVTALPKDRD